MCETPKLNARHDALDVFLGKRTARGMSFGGTDKSGDNPKSNGEPWLSTHAGTWHNGAVSLVKTSARISPGVALTR